MLKATERALRGSIEKWENILNKGGVDDGADNCPLCKRFFDKKTKDRCPLDERADPFCPCRGYCCDEYGDWRTHHVYTVNHDETLKINCPVCRRLAQRMLDRLKRELPEEEEE